MYPEPRRARPRLQAGRSCRKGGYPQRWCTGHGGQPTGRYAQTACWSSTPAKPRAALKHGCCCGSRSFSSCSRLPWNSTSRAAWSFTSMAASASRSLAGTLSHTNTGGVHQLDGCELVGDQFGYGACRVNQVIEHQQAGRSVLQNRRVR